MAATRTPEFAAPTVPTALTWDAPAATPGQQTTAYAASTRAVGKLTARIKRGPDRVALLVERGQHYGRIGKGEKALSDFTAALIKGNTDPLLNFHIARAALLSGNAALVEEHLRKQRELTPARPECDLFEARLWLAKPGILSQNCKQAMTALDKAVALDSTNITTRLLRGYAYFANNKYAPALREYQAVLARQPDHARTHFYIGQALVGAERAAEACPYFVKGEDFAPTKARWYMKKYCR
mgnify:FL=1